jgi:hypothetical protein
VQDEDLNTRWSAQGDGHFIEFCFGEMKSIEGVAIAFYLGDQRATTFDVEVSQDGKNWNTVIDGAVSSGTTLQKETLVFPKVEALKARIVGHGNSSSMWNSITEVEWIAPTVTDVQGNLETEMVVTPNPANTHIRILTDQKIDQVDLISIEGKGVKTLGHSQGEIDLRAVLPGVYFIRIQTENNVVIKKICVE